MYKWSKKAISQLLVLLVLATTVLGVGGAPALAGDTANARSTDVWDFGGTAVEGSSYTNHISVSTLDGLAANVKGGVFTNNTSFGDLTLVTTSSHNRLYYYNGTAKGALSYGNPTSKSFPDGYANKGTIYFAGSGDDSTKFVKMDNVEAGDIINVYGFVTNGDGPATVNFALTSAATGATGLSSSYTLGSAGQILSYRAVDSGTLKIYFTNALNSCKPNIARITRTPGVKVSGTLNVNGYSLSGHSLVFQNRENADVFQAALASDGTFDATLTAGYTFTAVLQGVSSEYIISDADKLVTTTAGDIANGINGLTLGVDKIPTAAVSGAITGFESGYDLGKLTVTLSPAEGSLAPKVTASVDRTALSYTAVVRSDVAYTVTVSGVNDYLLTSGGNVNIHSDAVQDITVAKKMVYTATGAFVGLPAGVTVTSLAFVNVNDNYSYTGTVTNGGYSVSLRDGAYAVKAVSSDAAYSTIGHVVVSGGPAVKDVKFSSTTPPAPLAWVGDLYVGDSSKEYNYTTVKEALAVAARMKPSTEAQRITVHIAPGTYREQLKIATPYISLVNSDPSKEVKITWYYGVGYDYYSAGPDGSYNEDRAFDKYLKGFAGNFKWGATVFLTSAATGFRAESITFENSFNKYVTEEEIEDGVQVTAISTATNQTVRTLGLDVTSKAATERAAAIGVEADNAEFYDCSFLSSQDTLYTGNAATNQYYKDCFIEGNTDYIFGDGNLVFDNCTLNFAGYSSQGSGGYITAAKPSAASSPSFYGYLFRDCIITGTDGMIQTPGYFGRPWGQEAKVTFLDTKLADSSLILPQGWTSMSGATPEKAGFYEYNTTYNGTAVDTSARTGKVLGSDAAVINVRNYFGSDWTPKYYQAGSITAPELTIGSVDNNQAVLTWNSAASTIGSVIYSVFKDGVKLGTTTATSYTVSNLASATGYSFKVTATNTAGDTASSQDVPVTTTGAASAPTAPVLTATAGNRFAALSWTTVTDATYYTVKGLVSGSTVYDMVYRMDGGSTVTGYTYSNLVNGTTYQFIVTASNPNGESPSSNVVTVTPGAETPGPSSKIKPEDFLLGELGNIDNPAIKGSASFDDDTNTFTVTGSGTGINKNATGFDQVYIAAVKLKGDYTISAKATYAGYIPGTGMYGNPGITIRESLEGNSYHYTQLEQYSSTAIGGRKAFRYNGSSNGSNSIMPLTGTAYLQLTKIGDKITSIISSSPIPEKPVGSETLVISTATAANLGLDANGNPKELYVGMLVTSANASKSITATYEDVKIVMSDGTVVFDANEGKPVAPKHVASKPYDKSALITWEALSTATSYTVKQSTSPEGPFSVAQTVTGAVYQAKVDGLENDKDYYFVVTASNASGESVASQVVHAAPTASAMVPPVITVSSAQPASEVFTALLPLSGSVDKEGILTVRNNGALVKLAGDRTSLELKRNGTFGTTLILAPGMNEIEIRVDDTYGFTTTKVYQVLYTYKAANINVYSANGAAVTGLAPGKEITVRAEVENYIVPTKDAVLVVGLYDAQNNLVKFICTSETMLNGETEVFYAKLTLPDEVKDYTLKSFIWDSISGMRPVSDVIELH